MKAKIRRLESKMIVVGPSTQTKRKLPDTVEDEQGLAQGQGLGQGLAQRQGQGLALAEGQGRELVRADGDDNGDEGKMILSDDQELGTELGRGAAELPAASTSSSTSTSQELLRMQVLHDNLSHLYDLLQRYGLNMV